MGIQFDKDDILRDDSTLSKRERRRLRKEREREFNMLFEGGTRVDLSASQDTKGKSARSIRTTDKWKAGVPFNQQSGDAYEYIDDDALGNSISKPSTYTPSYSSPASSSYTSTTSFTTSSDRHRATLTLAGKVGRRKWELYSGSESKVEDHLSEYDLIINCTGRASKHFKHSFPARLKLSQYIAPIKDKEIVLDWPDFGLPGLPLAFWKKLLSIIKQHRRTLLFCVGGHGRTGTALSILTMLHTRVPGVRAINFVRDTYCGKAVENARQEDYVIRIGEMDGLKMPPQRVRAKVEKVETTTATPAPALVSAPSPTPSPAPTSPLPTPVTTTEPFHPAVLGKDNK